MSRLLSSYDMVSYFKRNSPFCTAVVACLMTLLVACGDGAGPVAPRQVLLPSFTLVGGELTRSLAVERVRIRILRADSQTVAVDTVLQVPSGATQVDQGVRLAVFESPERFYLQIFLLDAADNTLFTSGSAQLTIDLRSSNPVDVPAPILTYTGPGSEAAEVVIGPVTSPVRFGQTIAMNATALDASGGAVTGAAIQWRALNSARATIDETSGALTGGIERGAVDVVALLVKSCSESGCEGPEDTVSVDVLPNPSQIVLLSGGSQSASVGATLSSPIVFEVRGEDGLGLADVTVAVAVNAGAASPDTVTSDGQGQGGFTWTLGTTSGIQTGTLSVVGNPAVSTGFSATADPGAVTTVTVSPPATTLPALGATIQMTAVAEDGSGNMIPDPTVVWSSTVPGVAMVDAAGLVTAVANGSASIEATINGVTGAATVTVSQDVSSITISPPSVTLTTASATQQFTADVRDVNGNPWTNGSVVWELSDSSVASIDQTGLATARADGTTSVFATADGVMDAATLTVSLQATTNENRWLPTVDGLWSNPSNWSKGAVPVATDTVLIEADGTYTVTLDVDATVDALFVDAPTQFATLAVGAQNLTLTRGATVGTNGRVTVTGGNITGGGTLQSSGFLELQTATLIIPVDFLSGSSTQFSGVNSLQGTVTTAAGSSLLLFENAGGPAFVNVASSFQNNGLLLMGDGTGTGTIQLSVNGTLFNGPSGDLQTIPGAGSGGRIIDAVISNSGIINIATNTQWTRADAAHDNIGTLALIAGDLTIVQTGSAPSFTNTGTIDILDGSTLVVSGGTFFQQSGLISGQGTIDVSTASSQSFSGVITPGTSPGQFDIIGDYDQAGGGRIDFELTGTPVTPGVDFDRLDITGLANLNGTIQVLLTGYTPTVGDQFPIMTYGSRTGVTSLVLPSLTPPLDWNTTFGPNGLTIEIIDTSIGLTWNGSIDTDWQNAQNWTPAQVPTTTDNVIVPAAAPNQPTLTAAAFAGNLTVEADASINTNGFSLAASGNVSAGTQLGGTGVLVMTGTGVTLSGSVSNLTINGSVTGAANVFVNGNLTVDGASSSFSIGAGSSVIGNLSVSNSGLVSLAGGASVSANVNVLSLGNLVLNGQTLQVGGDFVVDNNGRLTMTNPADVLSVVGNAAFRGQNDGSLTAGVIDLFGDFEQSTNPAGFPASGTLVVRFLGSVSQSIAMEHPLAGNSHFQEVEIANPVGVILASPAVLVQGNLSSPTVTTIGESGPSALTIDGNLALDGDVALTNLSAASLGVTGTYTVTNTTVTGASQVIPTGLSYVNLTVSGPNATYAGSSVPGTLAVSGNGASLTLTSNIAIGGSVIVTGTGANMTNQGTTTISGSFAVQSGATWTLAGPTTVAVDGSILLTGNLVLNGRQLTINGDLTVDQNGRLSMTNSADILIIGGNGTFNGQNDGSLTDGVIRVSGDFQQATNPAGFDATGTHRVIFEGAGVQNISFANPSLANSHFQHVDFIRSSAINLATDVLALGTFTAPDSATTVVSSTGNTLTASGLSVSGVTFNNTSIVSDNGASLAFDNVSLQNMDPTSVQLTVVHPGAASPFTFTNISFATTPTSGLFIRADDNVADANTLTIDFVTSNPSDGTAFEEELNGAIVNWPGQFPGITWTGAISTDWNDASNWSPALVPSIEDDVLIPASATNQPGLSAAASVNALTVQSGASIGTNGFALTAGGNVNAASMTGGGTLVMTGSGVTVTGVLPTLTLDVQGSVSAGGALTVGTVSLTGVGIFDVVGQAVNVVGDFVSGISSQLVMTNPSGVLNVQGTFQPGGPTQLTAGLLDVQGNFDVTGASFAPSGTHTTRLSGVTQTVAVGDGNSFQDLEITGGVIAMPTANILGNVAISGNGGLDVGANGIFVTGDLTTADAGILSMTNASGLLQVGGNATFDGGSTTGLLTAGTLTLLGNVTQLATNSPASFDAGSSPHVTRLAGFAPQTVSFTGTGNDSKFGELVILNTDSVVVVGTVNATGDIFISDSLATAGDSVVVTGPSGLLGRSNWTQNLGLESVSGVPVRLRTNTVSLVGDLVLGAGDIIVDVGTQAYGGSGTHTVLADPRIVYNTMTIGINRIIQFEAEQNFVFNGLIFAVQVSGINMNSANVTVAGGVFLSESATLTMGDGAILTADEFGYSGPSTDGLITGGTIEVTGPNFDVANFVATGTHLVHINGTADQAIRVAPGSSFQDLQISNTAGLVELSDPAVEVVVNGQLTINNQGPTTVYAALDPTDPPAGITAAGVNISNAVFDKVALTVFDGGAWTALDDVSFVNFDPLDDTPLNVLRAGGTPLVLGGTTSFTPINGAGGVYINAVDTDTGDNFTLFVEVASPLPAVIDEANELIATNAVVQWGSADAATSIITANPTAILADGQSTSTITVEVRNAGGNQMKRGGDLVTLNTSAGSLTAVTDNGDGTYTATLTSSSVGETATITGSVNGIAMSASATVDFVIGEPR